MRDRHDAAAVAALGVEKLDQRGPGQRRPARTSARRAAARAAASRARCRPRGGASAPPERVNGCAAARSARPRRSRSGPTIAATSASGSSERARTDGELVPDGRRQELVLGRLEDRPDAGQQLPRLPADRLAIRSVGELGRRDHLAGRGRQQAAQRERERRLARPVRPGHGEHLAGRELEIEVRLQDAAGHARDRQAFRGEQRRARRRAAKQRRPSVRGPAPTRRRRRAPRPRVASTAAGSPSATIRPSAPSTTMRVATSSQTSTRCSTITAVAPVAFSTRATASRTSITPAGSRFAVGSSSSSKPGRIASAPASARRCFWPPDSSAVGCDERHGEADGVERGGHALPDLVARNAEVLAAERDVVADACHARSATRDPAARARASTGGARRDRRRPSARPECSPSSSAPSTPASACSSVDLPEPDGAEQQHALPRFDDQVELAQRPGAPAPHAASPSRAPAPRRVRCARPGCDQTSARPSRPAANRLSAPVRGERAGERPRPDAGDDGTRDDRRDDVDRGERHVGTGVPEHRGR